MLLVSGIIVPFFIEGTYMSKKLKTYQDRRRTIRSFYLSPVVGLISTFCAPFVFFLYEAIGEKPGLFMKENMAWILPSVFGFFIIVAALFALGV